MKCPFCQFDDTKVVDSRPTEDDTSIRRRRLCPNCENRFTTYERYEQPTLVVIKKDKTREIFDKQKIFRGMLRACEKRPVAAEEQDNIVSKVEHKIRDFGASEVSSTKIGEYVMEELAKADDVAYIRFASVYRQFKDMNVFMQEVQELIAKEKKSYQDENK